MIVLKKVCSMLLTVAIMIMFCTLSLASTTRDNHNAIQCDSLAYTQEEYLDWIYSTPHTRTVSSKNNDISEIERVCIGLLSLGNASARSQEYDVLTLAVNYSSPSNELSYFKSTNDYLYAVRDALGWSVYEDNQEFSDFEVEITGNTANASIVETYAYYLDSDFESDYCFRKHGYDIQLIKNPDGHWCVDTITMQGTDEFSTSEPIDISKAVLDISIGQQTMNTATVSPVTEFEIYEKPIPCNNQVAKDSSYYWWVYDVDAGVAHAEEFYNSVDPTFGEASEDCANFASQCVWAGLGGTGEKDDLPALSDDYLGGTEFPNLWCRGMASTYYDQYKYNWTWDNVNGLTNMIEVSNFSSEGPYGNTHYGNLDYAAVGSVIAYTTSSVADNYNLTHAMYVTDVTGNVGSRGVSNIWIAAHNSNTDSAYMPLTEYTSKTEAQFATSVIAGGYYATPQP